MSGVQESTYIVVEGPIGVGKTTLVNRLAEKLPSRTVYEIFEENPFLADFYGDRDRYAFQTEMFFLLSRFRQQEAFAQADLFQPWAVSDYLWQKSRLFAKETLPDEEFQLFDHVFQVLSRTIPKPDVVVYLHAPLDVLLTRIQKRGRPYEANMDRSYLSNLCRVYDDFFKNYDETPIIYVDSSELNFAESDRAVQVLIEGIKKRSTRRQHLPQPQLSLFE
jgi:deoxyadenosine/deoxycytidine kinase